jgi:hypothetical protein
LGSRLKPLESQREVRRWCHHGRRLEFGKFMLLAGQECTAHTLLIYQLRELLMRASALVAE